MRPANDEQCRTLLEYFEDNSNCLRDDLEIISNVLVHIGCQYIDPPLPQGNVSPAQLLEFVTEHRKQHGETVANATILQGLIMLNWLDSQ